MFSCSSFSGRLPLRDRRQIGYFLLHLQWLQTATSGPFPRYGSYRDFPIKPVRRIRDGLIASEWPNIERILLSLALKTTTQSVIVSKLSAYRRKNRTKRALWEFDNIIRSLYLLD
jgi:hypothetical protein